MSDELSELQDGLGVRSLRQYAKEYNGDE